MHPLKSNRLAWSVACASLALWASTAPVTWGQVAAGTSSLFAQTTNDSDTTATTTTTSSMDIQVGDTSSATNDGSATGAACPTPVLPPAIEPLVLPTPVTSAAAAGQAGMFQICGGDPKVARDIEQLIGGRGFNASLTSHGDGCADLTIHPTGQIASGSSASNLSVSLGGGRNLSIHIVSAQGATHATITVS